MAKGSGPKARKKDKRAGPGRGRGAERLEQALAAALRREAKAASRLEAAQLEVAVLRIALSEVVAKEPAEIVRVAEHAAGPTPPAPAASPARPRRARPPAPADR